MFALSVVRVITDAVPSMQEPRVRHPSVAFENGQGAVFSSMSAAFSPIMIDGALVLPDVNVGFCS